MSGRPPIVLFVCTGNTCRSPMAAALLNARAGLPPRWSAESAGLAAAPGTPASVGAILAMREWNIDLGGHRSRPLTAALVRRADILVALAATHRAAILRAFPKAEQKTLQLGDFLPGSPGGIDDPFGGGPADYRRARDAIDRALDGFARFLLLWGGFA